MVAATRRRECAGAALRPVSNNRLEIRRDPLKGRGVFARVAIAAETLIEAAPGRIYWYGDVALNTLPYLPGHILNASLDELATMPGPAWIIITGDDANTLLARRPGALHVAMPLGERDQWQLLRLGQ